MEGMILAVKKHVEQSVYSLHGKKSPRIEQLPAWMAFGNALHVVTGGFILFSSQQGSGLNSITTVIIIPSIRLLIHSSIHKSFHVWKHSSKNDQITKKAVSGQKKNKRSQRKQSVDKKRIRNNTESSQWTKKIRDHKESSQWTKRIRDHKVSGRSVICLSLQTMDTTLKCDH